jgi:hypothetical protein
MRFFSCNKKPPPLCGEGYFIGGFNILDFLRIKIPNQTSTESIGTSRNLEKNNSLGLSIIS